MDHGVDPLHGAAQPFAITDIADKITQHRIGLFREALRHFELFEFVAAVDHQAANARISLEYGLDEGVAERAGATGKQDGSIFDHELSIREFTRGGGRDENR